MLQSKLAYAFGLTYFHSQGMKIPPISSIGGTFVPWNFCSCKLSLTTPWTGKRKFYDSFAVRHSEASKLEPMQNNMHLKVHGHQN